MSKRESLREKITKMIEMWKYLGTTLAKRAKDCMKYF